MISPWLFDKILKIGIIVGCFWLVGTAFQVEPDERGFGSHEQLGMEPCAYLEMHGHPCPSCGMTTSFAHTVRFQIPSALAANPAGTIMCLICLVLPGILVHSMLTGQPVARLFIGKWRGYWIFYAVGILGASWTYKILSHG
ncbi:MAG: hypothetical protein ACI97A_002328 [Planctomycetota bacterium]|jgi:hypothetical protein